jgi:hypothetical protein
MILRWQHDDLVWDEFPEANFMRMADGRPYKRQFEFDVEGRHISGWVGVLAIGKGGRDKAGFSILQAGRVIRGWPLSWRPTSLYGQLEGSNDLVNQRLVGEINLDGFQVTHTKDDIQWMGDEEDQVEVKLREVAGDYREIALTARKGERNRRGPTDLEIKVAVDEFQSELTSDELVDALQVETVPPPEMVAQAFEALEGFAPDAPAFGATVGGIVVEGYLAYDASPNDPYVSSDASDNSRVVIVVNMAHPHFTQLSGAEGVLNYFRDCTYDAISEWQARRLMQRIDPATVKLLKDQLLRIPMKMEMHAGAPD